MTELELRSMVRNAIARHTGAVPGSGGAALHGARLGREHSSHAMFQLPVGSDGQGACLIEPAVMCNHCGYCKSYGH
jgi:hypothetical protein